MKIVITGGAGYIGSLLANALKYHDVHVFDNLMYNQGLLVANSLSHCKFYKEDVTKWSDNLKYAIEDADVVYPLAALVGAPLCDRYPDLAEAVNAKWFDRLLSVVNGNQKIVYPNTNSGYGTTSAGTICDESTPLNPISLYGKTKKYAEDVLTNNYNNYTVFRLATVFGMSPRPRFDLLVNNLVLEAEKNKSLTIFDPHFRRNYVHIKDVVKAFNLARYYDYNEIYNLGNDNINCTKLELAKKICKATDATLTIDDSKSDPDKRDYEVSSRKFREKFSINKMISLGSGISEIKRMTPFITDVNNPMYKNY